MAPAIGFWDLSIGKLIPKEIEIDGEGLVKVIVSLAPQGTAVVVEAKNVWVAAIDCVKTRLVGPAPQEPVKVDVARSKVFRAGSTALS